MVFLGGSGIKTPPAKAGDTEVCLISGSERYPGGGNGNQLQYSTMESSTVRETWQATGYGVSKGIKD